MWWHAKKKSYCTDRLYVIFIRWMNYDGNVIALYVIQSHLFRIECDISDHHAFIVCTLIVYAIASVNGRRKEAKSFHFITSNMRKLLMIIVNYFTLLGSDDIVRLSMAWLITFIVHRIYVA